MDYEKKYKEAFEKAKEYHKFSVSIPEDMAMLESIFPELKEESEDERIKKMLRDVISQWRTGNQAWCSDVKLIDATLAWLEKQGQVNESLTSEDERTWIINYLSNRKLNSSIIAEKENLKKAIAWLEKQGEQNPNPCDGCINRKGCINCENGELRETEQKPTDKVEPKFKVGDWVVRNGETLQISGIDTMLGGTFHYWFTKGTWLSSKKMENAMLWTIQDAKKGDILQADKCTLIFDSLTKDIDGNTVVSSWYHCDTKTFYGMGTSEPDLWVSTNIIPATKEQRTSLFQKIKEAGYEWDAKQNKLKKIKQKPAIKIELDDNGEPVLTPFEAELFSMMSEAWQGYSFGEEVNIAKIVKEHSIELLERASEQKPAWSEEDEKMCTATIFALAGFMGNEDKIDWLESLKDRVQPQPKQEWSEEDKRILNSIIQAAENHCFINLQERNWLKSLLPQSQWKPSEEQISLLRAIVNEPNNAASEFCQITLKEVIRQLKKLREE